MDYCWLLVALWVDGVGLGQAPQPPLLGHHALQRINSRLHGQILDFTHKSDKIDFTAITSLTAVASATSAPSQIAAHTIEIVTSGNNTIVYANASSSAESLAQVDMEIHLTGVTNLSSSDILHH